MAISSVLQNTFKEELLGGYHSFNASGDTPAGSAFKIALYTSSADITTLTTAYSATNEVASLSYNARLKVLPLEAVKLCSASKISCLKLLQIADVIAIFIS